MRIYFATELEGVATYWRIYRQDGVTQGLTSHDKALTFDGITHQAAPGMLPSAIRKSNSLALDSAEVEGALTHNTIARHDLELGLYDEARVEIGVVDWTSQERQALFSGTLGTVSRKGEGFSAELSSAKKLLERDLVPRTSPTCRAEFCGSGCNLSSARFLQQASVSELDFDNNAVGLGEGTNEIAIDGRIRFLAGPQIGQKFAIISKVNGKYVLDRPLAVSNEIGIPVEVLDGCDRTLETCAARFDNVVNFRAEPFLPGNDVLSRYANPA